MSHRTAAWLAWALWAGCMVLIALALLFAFATEYFPLLSGVRPNRGIYVLMGVLSLVYPTVGALIASRLPTNPIGWIFCGVALLYSVRRFTEAYADYALLENLALPWGEYAAWVSVLVDLAAWGIAGVFVMLLFPDGRLPSRRWRIVAWTVILGAALTTLGGAFMPGALHTHYYVVNPFGVDKEVIGGVSTTYQLFPALRFLGMTLELTASLAALLSLILKLRRARGDERQQLKWFVFAAVPAAAGLSLILLHFVVLDFTTYFFRFNAVEILSREFLSGSDYVSVFSLFVLPVCTYIAILRYRLYDIDIIINRTLVYGSLTLLLALVYFGGVAATQALFQALTGKAGLPQLVVVASTLVIAALFNPLRHRVQGFIDRRFYRRKYDARKTLEAFSAQLREETDLDALSDDLVGVVRETMQPAHVSLWLRPETAPKGEQAQ